MLSLLPMLDDDFCAMFILSPILSISFYLIHLFHSLSDLIVLIIVHIHFVNEYF